VLEQTAAWLRRSRHRSLLRKALRASGDAGHEAPLEELRALAGRHFERWSDGRLASAGQTEAALAHLHENHPSIFIYDVRGASVLARRKTGAAARHDVSAFDARMYDKRINHYGTLLAHVLQHRGGARRFSLAIDLADIPHDDANVPVFGFQRLQGAGNPLLPDVDFFHHGWYLDDHDTLPYAAKSISACFVGASTGRPLLSTEDVRRHASERLSLAFEFRASPRVQFKIASAVQCVDEQAQALLRSQPYFSAPIAWQQQLMHRFLISVDGNGATCSRVVKALRSNSVLVKFASAYELFYFPLLKAGEHYLPASTAADVERCIDDELAQPGRHAEVSAAASAFARRVLVAPSVLAYTGMLLTRYAALYPAR
jgi:hypothetical protein